MKLWEKDFEINSEIERFTVGRDREMDLYLAPYDVLGSMAHITMLESIGLIGKDELPVLLKELRAIYEQAVKGEFVIEDVLLTGDLSYVWAHNSQYQCMKASAFVGQAFETESWLVSPAIDLSNVATATLQFEQAVNYASPQGALYVMVSTNYTNSVEEAQWIELNLSAWPAGSDWNFITSTANLSQYAGQRVFIGFKYTSTNQSSATWEVKNFVVNE